MDGFDPLEERIHGEEYVENLNLLLDQANEVLNANEDYERTLVEMSTRVKERIAVNAQELRERQRASNLLKRHLKDLACGVETPSLPEIGKGSSKGNGESSVGLNLDGVEKGRDSAVRGWVRGRPIPLEDILASEMDKALDSVLAENDNKQQLRLLKLLAGAKRMENTADGKEVNDGIVNRNKFDADGDDEMEELGQKFTVVVVHNQVKTSKHFGKVQSFFVPDSSFTFEELQTTVENFWGMERAFANISEGRTKVTEAASTRLNSQKTKRKKKTPASVAAEIAARNRGKRISAHVLQNEGGAMYLGSAAIRPRLDADIKAGVIENPEESGAPGVRSSLL